MSIERNFNDLLHIRVQKSNQYHGHLVTSDLFWVAFQINSTAQRLASDKGELLQQHADEVDQYERRIRSLTEEVSLL